VNSARRSSRLPSIWQAIQWCGADRLGHGVRTIDGIAFSSGGEAER
jgi:adenosine deaminase